MKTSIRVGNGCGFWGDNLDAPIELVRTGDCDYLTLEYLAELTMSILALQKQRDPNKGFAGDFLDVLKRLAPLWPQYPRLKIITNAGGMNPRACAEQAKLILQKNNLTSHRVAYLTGDDLYPRLDQLLASGHTLRHLDTGEPLSTIQDRVVSANAYLGAKPIVSALGLNASLVITGRVADASLTVAPAVHEFQWDWNDLDRIGAATIAGHLIECGAQVTGGLWCDWQKVPDLAQVGYPIAEILADGQLTISKPPGTGGRVNLETVTEQLLYEVGDLSAYLTPDVVADLTSIAMQDLGANRVAITKNHGKPPTPTYKVSIAYRDGFLCSGMLLISGPQATKKAQFAGNMILDRLRRIGLEFAESNIECLGSGDGLPGVLPPFEAPEIMLRVTVRDPRQAALDRFSKEFAPLVTSGPPGVTGYTTGRPNVREVFAFWPALIDKSVVDSEVKVELLPE